EDETGPAVEVPAERDLFRGGLGVDIHQAQLRPGALPQHLIGGPERRVDRWHEQLALDIADQHLTLFAEVIAEPAASRRARRVVVRAQNRSMILEAVLHLALIPDVIAGGEDIDP